MQVLLAVNVPMTPFESCFFARGYECFDVFMFLCEDAFMSQREAQLRQKELSDVVRINLGLPVLSVSTVEVVADTWEKLGPPPEIDYEKL